MGPYNDFVVVGCCLVLGLGVCLCVIGVKEA